MEQSLPSKLLLLQVQEVAVHEAVFWATHLGPAAHTSATIEGKDPQDLRWQHKTLTCSNINPRAHTEHASTGWQ